VTFDRARSILTIPSTDLAFAEHVARARAAHPAESAAEFERHLRLLFPRVVVRERSLSGEAPTWYVYRDGSWRPHATGPWWQEKGLPRIVVSADGWMIETSRTAADLLGIAEDDQEPHHFTDFVAPGTLEAATQLFETVLSGRDLEATIVLRPLSGDLIAIEVYSTKSGERVVSMLRLADDVDILSDVRRTAERPDRRYLPATDVAFRAYAERALHHMGEPTTGGLELRLRRLYPHAHVVDGASGWEVHRDRDDHDSEAAKWWLARDAARVRYDSQALILEANDAATKLFERPMVGHFWQEFVTPGSTEQVTVMLDILAEVGAAESRFRMPRPNGSLLEFDSYTEVEDDQFTTVFRPVD
jgi:PAS domain-containing protein